MTLLLRLRTQVGTWRLKNVQPSDRFSDLRTRAETELKIDLEGRPFTKDPSGKTKLDDAETVASAGMVNGDMIYAMIDEKKTGVHEASVATRKITKDGNIVAQDVESVLNSSGFRPGMLPLKSMKMQWTLNEFIALDSQFEYKVSAQKDSVCSKASLESGIINDFQSYMRNFDFRVMRVGYLYGYFLENNVVKVEAIYEPPQETSDTSFTIGDDESNQETVDAVAALLGMQKVGWVFAHPPREEGFFFSGPEVLTAAELQLEAAKGVEDTPFITVKLTINKEDAISVEAFQVSKQCMEMVAEGVLDVSENLGSCSVNPTFTALVEGRPNKEVDNNFFLVSVPIEQFESDTFVSSFPKANRIDSLATRDDLKTQFSKAGREGWTMNSLLADFHLLIYLTNFLSLKDDLPALCKAAIDQEQPLDEGYQLLLRSIAGIE